LFVCIIAQYHWAADVCCAEGQIKVMPRVAAEPSGRVNVTYDIRNEGAETAYNVTVTTFLGMDARKSEPYAEVKGGSGWVSYQCDFDMSGSVPGEYILVSRINFNDQAGRQHSVYQFNPLTNRSAVQTPGGKPALALEITPPVLNAKSPIDGGAKFGVTMTNNNKGQIRAALTFYLPDGISADVPERFYDIGPGGTKSDDIEVRLTASLAPKKYAYDAVVWYEYYGFHFARHVQGAVNVEEKPVLLIGFVVLSILVLAFVGGFVWWRRRKTL
jgi:hypothetical protein